jgi:Flp pilus assembly protein TadG
MLRRLHGDQSGASALMTVLVLPVLLGFAALAIDGGMAYVQKRRAQDAADAAAYSAATAQAAQGHAELEKEGRAVAQEYGFENDHDGVKVTLKSPPSSGAYVDNDKAVEAIVSRPMLTFFAGLFGSGGGTLQGRAVAVAGQRGDVCVHILNPSATNAFLVNGSPTLNLKDCAVQVNSNAGQALLLNGSPHVTAADVRVVGGSLLNGTPHLDLASGGIHTGQPALDDVYADESVPSGGCNYSGKTLISGSYTVPSAGPTTPTVICSSLTLNMTSGKVTFQPGIYVFKGTGLTINGSGYTVEGRGVSFVFAKSGSAAGAPTINGAPKLDLSAPSDGPTAGMLFMGDPTAASAAQATINGASTSKLQGALYFPKSMVVVNGANALKGDCVQLIADRVTFNGSGTLGLNCAGTGVRPIGRVATRLVE